jgi:hypothetical protein
MVSQRVCAIAAARQAARAVVCDVLPMPHFFKKAP